MPADLHTHTTFSDGSLKINRLARLAAAAGMTHLAISDHDTYAAADYSRKKKIQNGVCLVPAVELTCEDKQRKRQVHILCYYPDYTAELKDYFNDMAHRRNEALKKSMSMVKELIPAFSVRDAEKYAKDSGVVYKAHVMRVLMDYGFASSVYGEEYKKMFAKGAPCLVPPGYNEVYDMISMAHRANGVVVLAHPSVYNSMELCEELAAKKVIDGIEIEHPRNTPQDKETLYKIAMKYNLIVTGGTDFHGMNTAKPVPIGSYFATDENLTRIKELAKERGEKDF